MARIDHSNCTHPRTPAGRRACRSALTDPTPVAGIPGTSLGEMRQAFRDDNYIAEHIRKVQANATLKAKIDTRYRVREALENQGREIRMTGQTARKLARQAAAADRIQPRRSGARVPADASACVQAALHTGRGRCACGWATEGF